MIRAIQTLAVALAVTATSVSAFATPTFPTVMQDELKLSTEPACAVCHAGGLTVRGTVTTDLGAALMSRGMVAYDEAKLRTAIQALVAEKNPAMVAFTGGGGASPTTVQGPEYGCHVAGQRGTGDMALIAAAAVAGLVLARRRR